MTLLTRIISNLDFFALVLNFTTAKSTESFTQYWQKQQHGNHYFHQIQIMFNVTIAIHF